MKPMMQYVDVLFGNEEDSEKVLGVKAKDTDITSASSAPRATVRWQRAGG